mmetsp:Transcript_47538/g.83097  ORF Transcript_47538/g.83097 Transcript_47538/m.83097 type:complete len:241 (+) Transcript_47538:415-1137(+)
MVTSCTGSVTAEEITSCDAISLFGTAGVSAVPSVGGVVGASAVKEPSALSAAWWWSTSSYESSMPTALGSLLLDGGTMEMAVSTLGSAPSVLLTSTVLAEREASTVSSFASTGGMPGLLVAVAIAEIGGANGRSGASPSPTCFSASFSITVDDFFSRVRALGGAQIVGTPLALRASGGAAILPPLEPPPPAEAEVGLDGLLPQLCMVEVAEDEAKAANSCKWRSAKPGDCAEARGSNSSL